MANTIIGNVYSIGAVETRQTRNGGTFSHRSIILEQRRYDPNTGEEYTPNYPTIEFVQQKCQELDKFHLGDKVQISFEVAGVKYQDKQTGEDKFFTSLRGFKIEIYVPEQMRTIAPQPAVQYPQQGYAQSAQQEPFPPSVNPSIGLPF